jgi:hypothetical protein
VNLNKNRLPNPYVESQLRKVEITGFTNKSNLKQSEVKRIYVKPHSALVNTSKNC